MIPNHYCLSASSAQTPHPSAEAHHRSFLWIGGCWSPSRVRAFPTPIAIPNLLSSGALDLVLVRIAGHIPVRPAMALVGNSGEQGR
jgi:hypothetical protein